MRNLFLAAALAVALSSCASKESLAALDAARAEVQRIKAEFAADTLANGRESEGLKSALLSAESAAKAAREEVSRSKTASVAAPVAQVAEAAAPFANAFLPGSGVALVALASFLSQLAKRKGGAA